MTHAESRRRRRLAIGAASVVVAVVANRDRRHCRPQHRPRRRNAEGEPVLSRYSTHRRGAPDDARFMGEHELDHVRVPVVPVPGPWRRRDRLRLHAHRRRDRTTPTRCAKEMLGFSIRSQIVATNADGSTQSTSQPGRPGPVGPTPRIHASSDHRSRGQGKPTHREPRPVGRQHADHVCLQVASVQLERRRLRRDRRSDGQHVHGRAGGRRSEDPRARHGAERRRLGDPCSPTRRPPSSRTFLRPVASRAAASLDAVESVTSSSSRRSCSLPTR